MVNLFDVYKKDIPAKKKINLFDLYSAEKPQVTPTRDLSLLEKVSNVADIFNKSVEGAGFPAAARGIFSGLTAPIRFGANVAQYGRELAGYEPSQFLESLSAPLPKTPTGYMPRIPFTEIDIPIAPALEAGGEIVGSMGSGGPIFSGLQRLSQASKIPRLISTPVSGAITGAAISPEMPFTGAGFGVISPIALKAYQYGKNEFVPLIRALMAKQEPAKAFNKMLSRHDTLSNSAKKLYQSAEKLAESKVINPMKISDDIINVAKTYLPPKKNYIDLINKAQQGDYESLDKIFKDFGKRANKIYSNRNVTQAELDQAEILQEARLNLDNQIQRNLLQQGHGDIASLRKHASKLYAQKMKTYYDKNLPQKLRQIFIEGKRLRPGQTDIDLLKPFMERSDAMERFLSNHPELENEINIARNKLLAKQKLKPLGKMGKEVGLGGGLIKIAEISKDLL